MGEEMEPKSRKGQRSREAKEARAALVLAVVAALWSFGSTWFQSRDIEMFKADLSRKERVSEAEWQERRAACLEALDIVDAYFSTLTWTVDGKPLQPQGRTSVSIQRMRHCYNRLALSVRDPRVVQLYRQALLLRAKDEPNKHISADLVVDLRNAVRSELFNAPALSDDRAAAWIARIDGACSEGEPGCVGASK